MVEKPISVQEAWIWQGDNPGKLLGIASLATGYGRRLVWGGRSATVAGRAPIE